MACFLHNKSFRGRDGIVMKPVEPGRHCLLAVAALLLAAWLPASGAAEGARKRAPAAESRQPAQLLPLPAHVANGSTVELQCGRTYGGTLDLTGKYRVTVRTAGDCGKASITPAQPVSGWARHQGNIWSAPLRFAPAQVSIGGQPLELAHFPNKPQTWAKGKSRNPATLEYAMPHGDLAGALLVYRPFDWMIETRTVQDYEDGVITLGPKTGDAFDPPAAVDFYVEGKLWMLDAPGEWAYANERLYLWAPDGKSPEGRTWAAPAKSGIDASDSKQVTIDGVRIFSAQVGIAGGNSSDLHILNSEISNSAQDGIFAGGSGLLVDNVSISDSVQNGIYGYYGITDSVVTNSTVTGTGMSGMPKRSKGGIVFEEASGQRITNNKVLHSSYIGIRVHRNALVANNLIDGACLILTDCGGIYTFAPDKAPLNVRIEGNTVKNLAQRYAYGIYLDDHANGVIVSRNILAGNPGGLQVHNGFGNQVMHNVFSASAYEHILFNDTGEGGYIRQNRVYNNTFISERGEVTYRLWSVQDGAAVRQFAQFNDNSYSSAPERFAEVAGTGMLSFSAWKSKMKQDGRSSLKPVPAGTRSKAM
jgi:hypothetical protein